MSMKHGTKELIAYAAKIVKERGITEATMTKEVMGEVLKECIRRMDRAVAKLQDKRAAMDQFCESVAADIHAELNA